MKYYNGVRLSPFSEKHWTDGLSQPEIINILLENGAAYKYLEMLSYDSFKDGYFSPVDRQVFLYRSEELDSYLKYDIGAALVLMVRLPEQKDVIAYSPKDVGSLILPGDGLITADVLMQTTRKMSLNNAQVHELEHLLGIIGRSLGISLPPVPLPTDEEKYEAIKHLTLADLTKHPRKHYKIFIEKMLRDGTPAKMNIKEFHEFANNVLKTQ